MTGGTFVGLILLSMAWLFAIGGLLINHAAWRAAQRARPGETTPSGIPLLPGIVGSVTVFFSVPLLKLHAGIEVPWPYLWILLPLVLDLQGFGGYLLALIGVPRRDAADPDAVRMAEGADSGAASDARAPDEALQALQEAAVGSLLGTAVGDALGLPAEGLSRRRLARWGMPRDRFSLVLGRGMCSDDTDHACMVAQAIAVSGGNARRFSASLAWRLRFWLLALPAGVGLATARAILKLWLFLPPQASGVRSAGNGPAMRSALIGVCFAESDAALVMHCSASTTITHTDPRAECGALAVSLAARASYRTETPHDYLATLERFCAPFGAAGTECLALARTAAQSAARGESTASFASSIGCLAEVSGYIYHSVPVALHAWFSYPCDLPAALGAAIECGGDTDTTAAIVGGIVGARVGRAGIPPQWLDALWDWPRGPVWIEEAARRAALAAHRRKAFRGSLYLSPMGWLLHNLVFLAVVLSHGFRRLAPPY